MVAVHTNELKYKPIFVLGVPRSGTSLVAGALGRCGAWLGATVPPEQSTNPKGFFEHVALRETVNKRLLHAMGCDVAGVGKLPDLKRVKAMPGFDQQVLELIEREGYTGEQPWLFKDAKLTLLWPVYRAAFPKARWVIVKRTKKEIIRSCQQAYFMAQHSTDARFWRKWISEYLNRLEQLKKSRVWWREIWPQELITGGLEPLQQLVDELGLQWNEAAVSEFIAPAHWHTPVAKE